jgi:hypothetical protein
LIGDPRTDKDVADSAKKFLGTLLADNAIAFSQDRESGDWTGGYYLNSACYRLQRVRKLMSSRTRAADTALERVEAFVKKQELSGAIPDLDTGWSVALDALEHVAKHVTTTGNGRKARARAV